MPDVKHCAWTCAWLARGTRLRRRRDKSPGIHKNACLPDQGSLNAVPLQPPGEFQLKILAMILMLALAFFAMAAAAESTANAGRRIAGDLEFVTLPNGAVVPRLVSTSGMTVRQFWTNSVYGNRASMLVFQRGSVMQGATNSQLEQMGGRNNPETERKPNESVERLTQALECE